MTIFVPVAPGSDTSIPTGPQYSAPYTLVGPDGTRVVFNDQDDADYIGMVQELTGLDSPEVREAAENLIQMDGGIHGQFFFGRRPIVVTGLILNPISVDDRNRKMTKLMRASNAMRQDATLSWTLDGGYEQMVRVRRQQPLRIEGGWQKSFQCSLVAQDPRIYGTQFKTEQVDVATGQMFPENQGNTLTYPLMVVHGPCTNPTIWNYSSGQHITVTYTLGSSEYLVLDSVTRTVLLNNTVNKYGSLDFAQSTWFGIEPGVNDIRITCDTSSVGSGLSVQFRDAWI
jgi:phage-related protein